jgi:hypothetical protein
MVFSVDRNTLLAVAATGIFINWYVKRKQALEGTPPSPTPLPFLGNIFDLTTHKPWERFLAWSKKYNSQW